MMMTYLKMSPFSFIRVIVQGQLLAVVLLSAFVFALVMYRNWRKSQIETLTLHYADGLLTEILEFLDGGEVKSTVSAPAWFALRKKEILKMVFFEHFKAVNGPEKAFLVKRYEQLGFTHGDVRHAFSFFWWKRLRAISNLTLMEQNRFAPLFQKLISDRNELVVASAYLALSALRHPLNRPISIVKLPLGITARKNVMHQILRNWTQIYGHAFLVSQIKSVTDPELLSVLISALSSMNTPEIAGAYTTILTSTSQVYPEVIKQMLSLIRKVGDPSSSDVVSRYLENPNEFVRLHAVQYLVEIGEIDPHGIPQHLLESSARLRSWLKDFNQERVAA